MLRTRVRAGLAAGFVLSIVGAAFLVFIHSGDAFLSALAPAYGEPTPTTLRVPYGPRVVRDSAGLHSEIQYENVRVSVSRGTVLSRRDEAHQAALTYERLRRPPRSSVLVGMFAIFFTLSMTLTSYLRKFGQSRLKLLRAQVGVFLVMGLMALLAKGILLFTGLPEFWVPIAAVPLWISAGYDRRTAFLVSVVLAFVVASMLRFDLLLLSVMLAQGMAATLTFRDRKYTRHMLLSGAAAGVSTALLLIAISVAIEGHFDLLGDLERKGDSLLLATVGGGLLAGALGAFMRSWVQRVLGHVPRETLLNLTDLEQPLLKKMAREAPGSWEHSRAMANLAEAAASAIGADALLTRVGAYYHDLGKTTQCKYFVENLAPGERSPHEDLEPDVSADAIMAHVVVGAKILRDGGIPEPVVEFAYTHHGTQVVEYFFNKVKELGNPKRLSEENFRYPGMRPQTKETAILMLVDSIEAASRTVDPPEREAFETMIQRIIFTKLKSGQLDDSGLSLDDLRILVNRMTETLVNMHHHRIKYQWQTQQAEEFGVPSQTFARASAPEIEIRPASSAPPPRSDAPPAPPTERSSSAGVSKEPSASARATGLRAIGGGPRPLK
jgi:cyclic-di-AMP phosphodiesterase PgpH